MKPRRVSEWRKTLEEGRKAGWTGLVSIESDELMELIEAAEKAKRLEAALQAAIREQIRQRVRSEEPE